MKISAIVRSDCGGLGTLSRMFHDHLGLHRTLSLSRHVDERSPQWFTDNRESSSKISEADAEWLCDGADAVLTFETWYGDTVPKVARRMGVKTALVAMHECTPMGGTPHGYTDLVICPHALCLAEMCRTPALRHAQKTLLAVPSETRIPFRRRERAMTFLHVAGRSGAYDRNNTVAVIEAWNKKHVKSDARLIVRHQSPLRIGVHDSRVTCDDSRHADYWHGWEQGDVFLHPHKWDGLSLPMFEALAAGMPVMTTRFWPFCDELRYPRPRNGWLPETSQRMSIGVSDVRRINILRPIDSYETTPEKIGEAVDAIYGRCIAAANCEAGLFSDANSWANRRRAWLETFEMLVNAQPIPEVVP